MSPRLTRLLERVSRVPGVVHTLLVDPEAGVPVAGIARSTREDGSVLAALAATLHHRATQVAGSASRSGIELLHLEGERGHLLLGCVDGLLLVTRLEPSAQLGLLRLELRQGAGEPG
jgi:predicted regulator of Ras-like GTPase activity (Roadblock/LC7/MglB family)